MADFDFEFDEDAKPDSGPSGNFSPIPDDGEAYEFEVVDSDVVATRDGTGKKLEIEAVCISEPYKGRKVFDSFNVVNKSSQAQSIGQGQVLALAMACGLSGRPRNSEELHHRPFYAKVRIEEYFSNKHQKNMKKNTFKQFMFEGCNDGANDNAANPPAEKSQPREAPRQQAAASGGGAAAAGGKARPWLKK